MKRPSRPIFQKDEVYTEAVVPVSPKPTRLFMVLEVTSSHEALWEVDGYRVKDGKTSRELWTLHMVCPECRNLLTINSEKKAVEVTEGGLEVETFGCTWPGTFGQLMCTFRAALGLPKDNERFALDHTGKKQRVDAVIRR